MRGMASLIALAILAVAMDARACGPNYGRPGGSYSSSFGYSQPNLQQQQRVLVAQQQAMMRMFVAQQMTERHRAHRASVRRQVAIAQIQERSRIAREAAPITALAANEKETGEDK